MSTTHNGLLSHRRTVLYISKLFFLAVSSLPFSWAAPLRSYANFSHAQGLHPKDPEDPQLWLDLTVAVILVLLGGVFAGLTIALMGQDEINLQVVSKSGIGAERKHAGRVLRLIKRGKHWVLVTLLLSNVITNETLPIILDRSLGGGWPAVVGSTVAIVIFGEIIPQSVCVRFGLAIGAWMSPFVLILMYLEAPLAWPTAKLLDRLIGEEHGTTYSKAGLKTLVNIHKTFGDAGERLNEDEVTIIGSVLELKNKSVEAIMTPMDDVFTMSLDTVLDEKMMDNILTAGYSRIPIHAPDNPFNFVGMLLVKILIAYDPEDARPVSEFALAVLPEIAPDVSCLDILNFFQEGNTHMVMVSESPGENSGAVGVVTLEDVIEELIGEEIVDESDVFIDVHKAIRRLAPAPRHRLRYENKEVIAAARSRDGSVSGIEHYPGSPHLAPIAEHNRNLSLDRKPVLPGLNGTSPRHTTFLVRRRSSGLDGSAREAVTRRTDSPELRQHLKHLGPSNLASRPRSTRFANVKIKPGATDPRSSAVAVNKRSSSVSNSTGGGVGEGLLRDAGADAQDGVHALQVGYGTMENRPQSRNSREADKSHRNDSPTGSERSANTIRSLPSQDDSHSRINRTRTPRGTARSGSITESVIEHNGIRKIVLDISSSSSDDATGGSEQQDSGKSSQGGSQRGVDDQEHGSDIKKKKKKKKKRRKTEESSRHGESQPLFG